ncbi:low molecular weight protein arginine phosphatase [Actomonas aquatica]|uniref:protein-tyrosine-phosphatase n=1 Tax=Actomonas aquatica TaxID=2866162 RepID=A0ABZ1CBE2_9BACT|nr:low molecular weight protein arginine phosphatase [Opitutus sp. WL0086]WRQ88553.1 low molecular weight protein arginine phosphatase [Opitutus sp. WL0086]
MADPQSGLLLAVCTANICRSPMVEALLAHALKAEEGPLKSFRVASAGVAARSGDPASANSVTALKKVGLDISKHRSQPLTPELLSEATAVFVMTESHRDIIYAMFEPQPENIFLLREFMPPEADQQIADPYGGPLPLYEMCRDEIVEAIPSLLEFLRREIPGN